MADQISDAVLDKLLAYDPSSKVACETLVTTGQVVLAGEVKTKAYVDLQLIAREVIKKIGYTKGGICSRVIRAACFPPSTNRVPISTGVWNAKTLWNKVGRSGYDVRLRHQ